MARTEVWVRTDTKIIRADTIRAVGWAPPVAGVLLGLATSGEKRPFTIRVQPDLPIYLASASNTRDEWCEAAWDRAAGLDESLLHAVAAAAKIPGGAVVFLDHDDEGFPKQWEIEPLAPSTPTPE
jgi:hypothetical protein